MRCLILAGVATVFTQVATATQFGLLVPSGQKKCFSEHIGKHVLYTVDAKIDNYQQELHSLAISVSDPMNTVFSDADHEDFHTAFTSTHAGPHVTCIENTAQAEVKVLLTIAWGADVKDYSVVAKAKHLDETTTSLTRVEDLLRQYHRGLLYLRSREARMRQTNDSTANRLLMFCMVNVGVVTLSAGVQVLYFRRFFKQKKII